MSNSSTVSWFQPFPNMIVNFKQGRKVNRVWNQQFTSFWHISLNFSKFLYIFDAFFIFLQMLKHFAERQHRWHTSLVIEGIHEIMPQSHIHLIHLLSKKPRKMKRPEKAVAFGCHPTSSHLFKAGIIQGRNLPRCHCYICYGRDNIWINPGIKIHSRMVLSQGTLCPSHPEWSHLMSRQMITRWSHRECYGYGYGSIKIPSWNGNGMP